MLEITVKNGHASIFRDGLSVVETASRNLALRLAPEELVVHTGINCFSAPWAAGVKVNGRSVSYETARQAVGDAFAGVAEGAFELKGEVPSLAFEGALTSHRAGWTFLVTEAGTYVGQRCNAGDQIVCLVTGEEADDGHWTVLESNQPDMLLLAGGVLRRTDGELTGEDIDALRRQLRIPVCWHEAD